MVLEKKTGGKTSLRKYVFIDKNDTGKLSAIA